MSPSREPREPSAIWTRGATLFIHGFGSSGRSSKADQLRAILRGEVVAPSLTHRPAADVETLVALAGKHHVSTIVGSSLGGFYALAMAQWADINVVLVNPSLHPDETARRHLGTATVFDTGETFEWTERELAELRTLGEVTQRALDPATSSIDWSRLLVLLAEKDEVLDARQTARELSRAKIVVDHEQDHRFADLMPYADRIRAHAARGFDLEFPNLFDD